MAQKYILSQNLFISIVCKSIVSDMSLSQIFRVCHEFSQAKQDDYLRVSFNPLFRIPSFFEAAEGVLNIWLRDLNQTTITKFSQVKHVQILETLRM